MSTSALRHVIDVHNYYGIVSPIKLSYILQHLRKKFRTFQFAKKRIAKRKFAKRFAKIKFAI